MNWKKLSVEEIKKRVSSHLKENINYHTHKVLGLPGSYLDSRVFPASAPFLEDAPFLNAMLVNPNHIGVHTLGEAESYFQGTQKLEQEVVKICAEDILQGTPDGQDGYVAAGGTEANLQAIWVFRNYFMEKYKINPHEIGLLFSEDTHYSAWKAANVFGVKPYAIPVETFTRKIEPEAISNCLKQGQQDGIKAWAVVVNMATTLYGSADSTRDYLDALSANNQPFKIHVDAAFGGFILPFTRDISPWSFACEAVDSITLDAHKMLQAPYGTGLFLVRKGLLPYVQTGEAKYVQGKDFTLSGSRSGANAIAVWMILMTYGPESWKLKMQKLMARTQFLTAALRERKLRFFHAEGMNIVSIWAEDLPAELATQFSLVPDDHAAPKWWKVVVMEHVTEDLLTEFLEALDDKLVKNNA